MRALRASFGDCCVDCGARKQLEFSHEEPTGLCGRGRGQRTRYFDVKKNPGAYRLRCRRCHRKHDAGHWSRLARIGRFERALGGKNWS
jgi:hypothetical protein